MEQLSLFKSEIPLKAGLGASIPTLGPTSDQENTTGKGPRDSRNLKIEESWSPWTKTTKPKIRIQGNWLHRAGFVAGNRVCIKCIAQGIIELRAEIPSEQ